MGHLNDHQETLSRAKEELLRSKLPRVSKALDVIWGTLKKVEEAVDDKVKIE